jgi:hypothetical protein
MNVVRYTAESPDVTDDYDRGARIQERLDALGITDREFYARTGIDRKTLRRAVANDAGVRHSTYIAIDAALDKMEAAIRGLPVQRLAEDVEYVEFTVEGNFGVRAVVKGPVKDMDELQRAVTRLIKEMRGEEDPDSGTS